MDITSLADLKAADLPHATCESIGLGIKVSEDTAENRAIAKKMVSEIDEYLQSFTVGPTCPACDTELAGLCGSFTWGLASGEGLCGRCGYPVRGHHPLPGFTNILQEPLPYHPSVLKSVPEPESEPV